MAEQALVADLRIGLDKFNADLQKAQSAADRATANMRKALENVGSGAGPAANEIQKVNTKFDETTQAANNAARAVSRNLNPALQTMKGLLGALGIDVGARALVEFATSAIKAAESITGVERQLTQLRGDSKAAAAEMAFVRAETDRLALSNIDGAKAYARLANAAKGTRLDGEALKFIFQAIGETMRATGASSEEYNRVLNQLTQTMAKGKFQGEELMTLAENGVPAYQKLAAAMGVTTKELSKMLEAGSVTSENMLLLANQLHKDYSALAEAASTSIPAQFTRGFNTIFNEFVDLTKGVLASSEAIKAIKFESNMLDIFPDPSVISQTTDNIIKIVVTIAELSRAIFQKVGDIIMGTFQDIADFLGKILPNLSSFFDKFASWSTKLGQALGFVSKDIDTVSLSTEDLQKSILGITSVKGVGDVMAPFTGSEGKALVQDVRRLANEVANLFGTEMPPIVDPKKQKDAAKKTAVDVPPVVQELVKKLEALNRKTTIINPEEEKKAAQELKKAAQEVHDDFLRILDRTNKERIRQNEEWVQQEKASASKIQDIREKLEDETRKEAEKTHAEFLRIVERTNAERIAETEKANAEIEKTFENMKENIQSSMADTISGALDGDLRNIKDAFDTITDIAIDTFSNIGSALITSFAIDPLIDKLKAAMIVFKDQFKKLGESFSGLVGTVGQVVGGVAAGVGAGYGVSGMVGGGTTGGIVGGAVGGMVTGATIGMLAGPAGAAIGAAAGAVIGGIVGGLMAENDEKIRLILQTSLGPPTRPHEGPTSRGPFGIVSLFDQSVVSREVASSAAMAIAEIDAAIAGYLDTQQRAIVETYFQTALPEGSTVQAEQMDDAIAKAIQLRLFHALTALTDQATATNIVGEAYSATAGDIQAIQQRAMEALAILKMIEEFKVGPLTATATAIKNINEQFQALADRASMLGLPIDEIVAEQNRLLAEVTTNFNQGIADSLLAIVDPVAAQFEALERMQQERMQNAIDAGADLVAVEKLNAAERVELERQVNAQIEAEQMAARGNIVGLILGMTDPFAAAMHQINQQLLIFQAQAAEGLIPQHLIDQWYREASDAAQAQEDARAKAAADATADFNRNVADDILALTDPVAAEFSRLEHQQQQQIEAAIAAGADLEALERLHALERAALEKRLAEENADTAIAASTRQNEAIVRGSEDVNNAIASGNQGVNDSIVSGNQDVSSSIVSGYQMVNDAIVSGAQSAASAVSSVFADAANAAASIIGSIQSQAAAASRQAAAAARAVTASTQRPAPQRTSTGGARPPATSGVGYGLRSTARRPTPTVTRATTRNVPRVPARNVSIAVTRNSPEALTISIPNISAYRGRGVVIASAQRPSTTTRNVPRAATSFRNLRSQNLTINIPDISRYRGGPISTPVTSRPAPQRESQNNPLRYGGGSRSSGGGSGGGGSRSGGSGGGGGGSSASQRRADADRRRQESQRQAEQRKQDRERQRQEAEQRRQQAAAAKANIQGMILDMTDPFGAAMHRVNQQVAEFRQQVKEGLIPKSLVDRFAKLATAKVKEEEVERRRQEAEEKRQQQIQFGQALLQFVNPTLATMIQINEQVREFQELADKGLVPQSRIDQFQRLALATAQVDRALDAISGSSGSNIKQVGDAFKSFIEAGLPEKSEAIHRMQALTDQVAGLIEAAKLLGLSTEDLEKSYRSQALVIREEAIKAIDDSLEPRRQAIESVDKFLQQMKVSDVLPGLMQLNEARQQFVRASSSGQIEEAVQAASQYEQTARQQLGSTAQFFAARAEIEKMLTTMRAREEANIERERAIAIRNEERQLQMVNISRNSVDYLRVVSSHSSTTANGINEMIRIARSQTAEFAEMRKLLTRMVHTVRA